MELLDILTYPEQRSARGDPQFEQSYTRNLKRYVKRYRRFKLPIDTLSRLLTVFSDRRKVDLVFVGTDYLHLMRQVSGRHGIRCLVQNERELRQALRHRVFPLLAWRWRADLNRAHEEDQTAERAERLRGVVTDIETVLKDLSPRAVVLSNDSLFLERALAFAARAAGIPTLTIQHGLLMQSVRAQALDGAWSDHLLVWSEFFRELYLAKGIISESRIHVLGYPFAVEVPAGRTGTGPTVVCILGQPWEKYDRASGEIKMETISNLLGVCRKLDLEVVYRPHPGEDRGSLADFFPGLEMTAGSETLNETIDRCEVFFSWTSTALIQAAMMGRTAVQIRSADLTRDDFSEIGACYSITDDPSAMELFLEEVKRSGKPPRAVSEEYIHHPPDLGEAFCSIMDSLPD